MPRFSSGRISGGGLGGGVHVHSGLAHWPPVWSFDPPSPPTTCWDSVILAFDLVLAFLLSVTTIPLPPCMKCFEVNAGQERIK